jgi:hypothetical protein
MLIFQYCLSAARCAMIWVDSPPQVDDNKRPDYGLPGDGQRRMGRRRPSTPKIHCDP